MVRHRQAATYHDPLHHWASPNPRRTLTLHRLIANLPIQMVEGISTTITQGRLRRTTKIRHPFPIHTNQLMNRHLHPPGSNPSIKADHGIVYPRRRQASSRWPTPRLPALCPSHQFCLNHLVSIRRHPRHQHHMGRLSLPVCLPLASRPCPLLRQVSLHRRLQRLPIHSLSRRHPLNITRLLRILLRQPRTLSMDSIRLRRFLNKGPPCLLRHRSLKTLNHRRRLLILKTYLHPHFLIIRRAIRHTRNLLRSPHPPQPLNLSNRTMHMDRLEALLYLNIHIPHLRNSLSILDTTHPLLRTGTYRRRHHSRLHRRYSGCAI